MGFGVQDLGSGLCEFWLGLGCGVYHAPFPDTEVHHGPPRDAIPPCRGITQLKAQGLSRTCNESQDEEEEAGASRGLSYTTAPSQTERWGEMKGMRPPPAGETRC